MSLSHMTRFLLWRKYRFKFVRAIWRNNKKVYCWMYYCQRRLSYYAGNSDFSISWGGRKVGFWISIFAGYLENIKNSLTRWENSGSIKSSLLRTLFWAQQRKQVWKKLEKRYWQCLNDMLIYKSSLGKTLLRWTMNIENSIVQKFCKCTTFSIL